jgi:hypothetical protein
MSRKSSTGEGQVVVPDGVFGQAGQFCYFARVSPYQPLPPEERQVDHRSIPFGPDHIGGAPPGIAIAGLEAPAL